MGQCWCCGDELEVEKGNLIESEGGGGKRTVRTVCVMCEIAAQIFPEARVVVDGERFTIRPKGTVAVLK